LRATGCGRRLAIQHMGEPSMKFRPLRSAVLIAAALLFAGCIKDKTVVMINPDGSGNIVVSTVFTADTVKMIEQMTQSVAGQMSSLGSTTSTNKEKDDPFYNEKTMRAGAKKFGPDVKFVKATKVDKDGAKGFIAVYSFKNVNDIYVNTQSSSDLGSQFTHGMGEDAEEADTSKPADAIEFNLAGDGPNKVLKIHMPKLKEASEDQPAVAEVKPSIPEAHSGVVVATQTVTAGVVVASTGVAEIPDKEEDESTVQRTVTMTAAAPVAPPGAAIGASSGNPFGGMMPFGMSESDKPEDAMKKMFKGMEMSVAVQVKGAIVKTNARHVEKDRQRVTLMNINFDEMLKSPSFSKLLDPESLMGDGDDPSAMMKKLTSMPGADIETNTEVVIEFK
jgi:hypothetical protein